MQKTEVLATEIRAMHHYAYRSGQWATILTIAPGPKPCYVVRFADGATDWWPVDDAVAEYEFR